MYNQFLVERGDNNNLVIKYSRDLPKNIKNILQNIIRKNDFTHSLRDNIHTYTSPSVKYSETRRRCITVKVYERLLIMNYPLDMKKLYNFFKGYSYLKNRIDIGGDETALEWDLYFYGESLNKESELPEILKSPRLSRMDSMVPFYREWNKANGKKGIPVLLAGRRYIKFYDTPKKVEKDETFSNPIKPIVSFTPEGEEITSVSVDIDPNLKKSQKQAFNALAYMKDGFLVRKGENLEVVLITTQRRDIPKVIRELAIRKLYVPVVSIDNLEYYIYKNLNLIRGVKVTTDTKKLDEDEKIDFIDE